MRNIYYINRKNKIETKHITAEEKTNNLEISPESIDELYNKVVSSELRDFLNINFGTKKSKLSPEEREARREKYMREYNRKQYYKNKLKKNGRESKDKKL